MGAVVPYLLPLAIVITANWGVRSPGWRAFTHLCLALLDALTFAAGLLLLATPALLRLSGTILPADLNYAAMGWALVVTALLSLACLATPLRRLLARWLPIDPASPVHTTALSFFIYLGASSLALLLSGASLLTASLETADLGVIELVAGQAIFLLFALAGVGLGMRRNVQGTLERLKLHVPKLRHLAVAALIVLAFLVLDYVTSLLWRQLWPANYELVSAASEKLFARFFSPSGALLLALSAAIGEETLFRGAVQPRFRVPLTAALFAVAHVQYALSPATVEILIVGLVLGWVRERFNTTTCMVIHASYNFLDILLMPLLP